MIFLKEIFNLKIKEFECKYSFPNYINRRYKIHIVYLDEKKSFFIYPKVKIESMNILKKHIEKIKQKEKIPTVVILEKITARERAKYIQAKIPFIVKDKQCFLPFLGTLLTERCDVDIEPPKKITPATQALLFYFIYKKAKDMYIQDAISNLEFSSMTISRAVKELEQIKLVKTYKDGVKKLISSELSCENLFEKAKPFLSSPIKRKQYISKENLTDNCILAGDSALSRYSMLNPPYIQCYATNDAKIWRKNKDEILTDDKKQAELQIWKYKPCTFKKTEIDVLSVAMSYLDVYEERVEKAVEEMLAELWRQLDD